MLPGVKKKITLMTKKIDDYDHDEDQNDDVEEDDHSKWVFASYVKDYSPSLMQRSRRCFGD